MKKVNYHTHSRYCDGRGELREYVEAAISKGFTHLGFSGHSPMPFESSVAIAGAEYGNYCSEIRKLKEEYSAQIKIFLGLEIDYIPGILDDFGHLVKEGNLDYCIGSVHLVNRNCGHDLWFIDGKSPDPYDEGLRDIFGGNVKEAVTAFFRQNCEMIETQRPTIVGHFDKIVMHNKNRFFDIGEPWFRTLVMDTVELIRETGCICEINTRGLYKGRYCDFYPSKETIREMNRRNIPVVVSTDAHQPSDLDMFEGAYEFLREIEYRNLLFEFL